MTGSLPPAFLEKMKTILEEEFSGFIASYEAERLYGLRVNELKLSAQQWKELSPFGGQTRPIPWTSGAGMYVKEGVRPGKHPHYHAGLYYIQEPSAMAPVELLDVLPGQRVLDLCAAPGGKSTQIAAKLQGRGVLVTNDNAKERTKALAKNVELAGVRNAIICNEEPSRLVETFRGWFDRILVDAPCSGEGMFRKDESMIAEWEKHSVEQCSSMQRTILRDAAAMLAPGGKLVYSTCTFSPEENEAQIAALLAERPDFEVAAIEPRWGWKPGRPDLAGCSGLLEGERLRSIEGTARLWPHHIEGEGHYAALLCRKGGAAKENALASGEAPDAEVGRRLKRKDAKPAGKQPHKPGKGRGGADKGKQAGLQDDDAVEIWRANAESIVQGALAWESRVIAYGARIYIQPPGVPPLDGLRIVRPGWYVGEGIRGRLEPSQPLAMGLKREEAVRSINWSSADERTLRYLKGETVFAEDMDIAVQGDASPKGYVLVCADGYPIGWGKYADGMLKNMLPAGWRWM